MYSTKLFIALALPLLGAAYFCPREDVCTCTGNDYTCVCEDTENLTLSMAIGEDVENVIIRECYSVVVQMGVLSFRLFEKVEFGDIEVLVFEPFALIGLKASTHLLIENINNLQVRMNGLSGLQDIETLMIRNVSANISDSGFGRIENVKHFAIVRSNLGTVLNSTFHLIKVASVTLEDSKIQKAYSLAFVVYEAENVSITRTTINYMSNASFLIYTVSRVEVEECFFEVMSDASFAFGFVQSFIFRDSEVGLLAPRALQHINVTKEMIFENNLIQLAEKYSLPPSHLIYTAIKNEELEFSSCNNSYNCNCHLAWLWEVKTDRYKNEIRNGSCFDLRGVKLADLTPVRDSHHTCIKMSSNLTGSSDTVLLGGSSKMKNYFIILMLAIYKLLQFIMI